MKYINKTSNLANGLRITENYLNIYCKNNENRYINISYDDFCHYGYKQQMIDCLKRAQGNYCCYCMRDMSLSGRIFTLEHIVPQQTTGEDIVRYRSLGLPELQGNRLSLTSEFTYAQNQTMPPYPHNVSYDNFLNSCNGKFPSMSGSSLCCNNKRGNKYAIPLPLYPNVDEMVVYLENGEIQPNASCGQTTEVAQAVAAYGLNCDNLRKIRRLWYLLRNVSQDDLIRCIDDSDLRNKIIMSVIPNADNVKIDYEILVKYIKRDYWITFWSYNWFKDKFQNMFH